MLQKPPKELERINQTRKRMENSDDESAPGRIDSWERTVKTNLIFLSLDKHEGIQMLLARAKSQIVAINVKISTTRPTDLSTAGIERFANETARLFDQKDMWEWLLNLFIESQERIAEVMALVDEEDQAEDLSSPQAY